MNYIDFLTFKEQPCRFKLKSGKEVYGVIWEERHNEQIEFLFASSSIHNFYKASKKSIQEDVENSIIYKLSLDEVLYAEPLAG